MQLELIDITDKVGRRHLLESHPADAVPAALQNMHATAMMYGATSVKLALSYLMLAESAIGQSSNIKLK